jgi:hypothetical protein
MANNYLLQPVSQLNADIILGMMEILDGQYIDQASCYHLFHSLQYAQRRVVTRQSSRINSSPNLDLARLSGRSLLLVIMFCVRGESVTFKYETSF